MIYNLSTTNRYEKDVKLAKKRGLDIEKLIDLVEDLVNDVPLPSNRHDHPLIGDYAGCRECHIEPDWLLIYEKTEQIKLITLLRTGTHSDLF